MNSSSLFWGSFLIILWSIISTGRDEKSSNCRFQKEWLTFTHGDCVAHRYFPVCSGFCQSLSYFDLQDNNNGMPLLRRNCGCCMPDPAHVRIRPVNLHFYCPYDGHSFVGRVWLHKPARHQCKCFQCSQHLVK